MPQDLALSREHFQVENSPPVCHLVDLGSTNGTKVNGLRVERVLLREGDMISAGDSCFSHPFRRDWERRVTRSGTCAGCGVRWTAARCRDPGTSDAPPRGDGIADTSWLLTAAASGSASSARTGASSSPRRAPTT